MDLLYRQVPQSAGISVLVASVLCVLMWHVVEEERLVAWWIAIAALSVARVALVHAFRRRPAGSAAMVWERWFVATLVMTGIAWGVGGWFLTPRDSIAHQAVVFFFLMGMAGGAVANYSAHVGAVTTTIVVLMLPATLEFAAQDNQLTRTMALGALIYVVAAFRAARIFSSALRRSIQLTHELHVAREAAELQARTDALTGMRNRRAFHEQGELLMAQARRYDDPLALISLDVDHFKGVNDTWGHAAGDATLRCVAEIVHHTIRTSDVAGRVGGEEFAILLPRASAEQAAAMAERLRASMEATPVRADGRELRFTASFGVAVRGQGTETLEQLLALADKALYEAKQGGRNRVVKSTQ